MSKRVLVTGGAGFLGSHLCDYLLHRGATVFCLDDFSSAGQEHIKPLRRHARFQLLQQDVAAPLELSVEEVYNLACPASPVHYQRDPIGTTRTCVLGALNMLRLAQKQGAKILQASTSEVYGDPKEHPQSERYWGHVNPIGPRSCYTEGKRCAESLFYDYRRQHGVAIRVARLFNCYGPRMQADDGRVISNFIMAALRGEPLLVHGDGQQTRSFCYVDDMVDGLVRCMEAPGAGSAPVNLGNPEEVSMQALAEQVLLLTGSSSRIQSEPALEDDPRQRQPTIKRADEQLNWQPTTSLEQGLAKTISYFSQRY